LEKKVHGKKRTLQTITLGRRGVRFQNQNLAVQRERDEEEKKRPNRICNV